ncbi:DUF5779 family protein [Haloprofundus salinisoli]|uniref:DUF5779 family protein n=1 Tax=Haloprofundus salinisoli TaxID=2876193 RepID=UPI001CCB2978|nr:DUF5779 family protein [Haloprofundus salinisoli]
MSEFDLDLRTAESHIENGEIRGDVVLGVLDGSAEPSEWVRNVKEGNVLVLSVQGDLNKLAAGFAREVKDMGGQLMHFRTFLVVSPPGVDIDTDRLR